MKTISLDIEDKDWEALHVSSERITYKELKEKILVQEARTNYEKIHQFSKDFGLDKMSEEEIFAEVAEAKKEIYAEKHKHL